MITGRESWLLPATAIVAIEYSVALLIGANLGFRYSIPFASYLIVGLCVIAVSFGLLLGYRMIAAWSAGDVPADFSRFAGFSAAVVLVTLQMAVLTWLKVMLPIATPFWADPLLADLDRAIFGTDPWRLSHALLGQATWLDRVYVTWAPIKMLVLVFVLAAPEDRRKAQALLTYFVMFAVGTLGQFALPSAGPVFYRQLGLGERFAELPVLPWVRTAADYLWRDYTTAGGHIGTGISAMPSMHVALALWVALVLRSYWPRLQFLGWLWFACILVGSVHLGWHYAVDGFVSAVLAVAAWLAARWITGRPASSAASPAAGESARTALNGGRIA